MRSSRIGLILLAGALVLGPALPALAQDMRSFGPRAMGPHPLGPWMWVGVGLFWLLRLILVAGLAALAWKLLTARGFWQRPDTAVQILRERYARGEIGEEEYAKRLGTLA
jgi:putative membrane protein